MVGEKKRLLIIGDSLTFHGPNLPEPLSDPRLFPQVAAAALDWDVDVIARMGWTARDAWWALTRDPQVYSVLVPKASVVMLAVGSFDYLPASIPTYLREGLSFVRPGGLRRRLKAGYRTVHPRIVRATGGRMRMLPQAATDHYLTRCVRGLRLLHPGLAVIGLVPHEHRSPYYGFVNGGHAAAASAARAWGERESVPLVDAAAIVAAQIENGPMNADGMHWSWPVHAAIGQRLAELISQAVP